MKSYLDKSKDNFLNEADKYLIIIWMNINTKKTIVVAKGARYKAATKKIKDQQNVDIILAKPLIVAATFSISVVKIFVKYPLLYVVKKLYSVDKIL